MPDAVKAAHYIQLLDEARCDEDWNAVPELVRKVRKHAPERACLTLTAETEHGLSLGSQGPTLNSDEGAQVAPTLSFDAAGQASKLIAVIEANTQFPEDRFQAQVCLGWLHWVVREYENALTHLPQNFELEYPQYENLEGLTEWTKVCALKSAYLKANCLNRNGQREEAIEVFDSSVPSLAIVWVTPTAKLQLRYWSELFLTEACMLSSQAISAQQKSLDDPNCLACFRAWSKYWATAKEVGLAGGYGFRGSVPRRMIWGEYYAVISQVLQEDLPYPTGFAVVNNDLSARNQLRVELKKVEVVYQGLLYNETRFPRADEERREVEEFVDRLMHNWSILSGRGWREQDLGQGGRESLSRGVLDSLYGAAMKTFHSTAVLRHLFIVHLAVAEFDLAFKSFDAWLELMKKGKARVEKTGHPEPSLDDDATVLETISACIAALCRYGDRAAAEKAKKLASELEHWLSKLGQYISGTQDDGISPLREDGPVMTYPDKIPPHMFALSWQSIGLAYAQWARVTFESDARPQLQDKAIQYLRKSLSPEFGHAADVRGVFALGLLYAEQRKLAVAIDLVKAALLADSAPEENQELYNGAFWRERALIPLWHLLALMLSARQEYFLAARACEGAIEQFRDPAVLFGGKHLNGQYRSDHLNEAESGDEKEMEGLVDDMDDYEKESILEIKMTQLAILEVVEGPAIAVNASRELLALFPRLFGGSDRSQESPSLAVPPKTSAGTLRSFRTSVFGARSVRSGKSGHTARQSVMTEKAPPTPRPLTMQTTASTIAPTIQVTNERGDVNSSRRSQKSGSMKRRSESGRRNSLKKRDSSGSRRRARSTSGVRENETYFSPFEDLDLPQYFTFASKNASSQASTHGQHHSHAHSVAHSQTSATSADLAGISVNEVETFAAFLPRVQFPQDHSKRRRGALLSRVWLLIAGFYRRADRFDNAQEACAEALRIVQGLEADISKDTTGSLSLRHAMWGEQKSMQELLADIWAERGYLSVAKEDPYLARSEFESALIHFADHPSAIVGLADILLDIYTERLPPVITLPALGSTSGLAAPSDMTSLVHSASSLTIGTRPAKETHALPFTPLGLRGGTAKKEEERNPGLPTLNGNGHAFSSEAIPPVPTSPRQNNGGASPTLPPPHKAKSLLLADRLAARDRAYGLLSGLTKLGSGWNYSEAWFTLARAYKESGQPSKAKDVLWWCVELEDGVGVRGWDTVGSGNYVL